MHGGPRHRHEPGILRTGGVTFTAGSTFIVGLNGPYATAGIDYDQLNVTGTVALGNAEPGPLRQVRPTAAGTVLVLIRNDGIDPVTGTFSGLPEGSPVTVGSFTGFISYAGGDGNDVTLTVPGPVTFFEDGGRRRLRAAAAGERARRHDPTAAERRDRRFPAAHRRDVLHHLRRRRRLRHAEPRLHRQRRPLRPAHHVPRRHRGQRPPDDLRRHVHHRHLQLLQRPRRQHPTGDGRVGTIASPTPAWSRSPIPAARPT